MTAFLVLTTADLSAKLFESVGRGPLNETFCELLCIVGGMSLNILSRVSRSPDLVLANMGLKICSTVRPAG